MVTEAVRDARSRGIHRSPEAFAGLWVPSSPRKGPNTARLEKWQTLWAKDIDPGFQTQSYFVTLGFGANSLISALVSHLQNDYRRMSFRGGSLPGCAKHEGQAVQGPQELKAGSPQRIPRQTQHQAQLY